MKKIVTSSIFKSLLIFSFSLLLFWFYTIHQIEDKLNEFFHQRYFQGRVQVQSIFPQMREKEGGDEYQFDSKLVEIRYTYIETVKGKEVRYKMKTLLSWNQIYLPHYKGEFALEKMDSQVVNEGFLSHDLNQDYRDLLYQYLPQEYYSPYKSNIYNPYQVIYQEAIMLNPQLPALRKEISQALKGIDYFEGAKIRPQVYLDDAKAGWFFTQVSRNILKGEKRLGGAYDIDLREGVKNNVIYISFSFENGGKPGDTLENFRKAVQNGLPDGTYLYENEEILVKDGQVAPLGYW